MSRLAELYAGGGRLSRPDAARVTLRGGDVSDFLQRMITADVGSLDVGGGAPSFLLERTGRVVDRVFVTRREEHTWLLGNDGRGDAVREWVDKYVIADDVQLQDEHESFTQWTLFGPAGREWLTEQGCLPEAVGASVARDEWLAVAADPVAGGSWHLLVPRGEASAAESALAALSEVSAAEWSELCLVDGQPRYGHEYTDRTIPLETGMLSEISFDKGCYLGQEVIARLYNYKRVKRALVRLRLDAAPVPAPGEKVFVEDETVGEVTGAVAWDGGARAFAYVDTENVEAALVVGEERVPAHRLGGTE